MTRMLPVLLAVLLLSSGALYLTSINKIEVIQTQPCLNTDLNLEGKNLLFLNADKLKSQIKSQFSCASDVIFKRTFPSRLTIQVQTNTPVAKIAGTDLSLTADGQVIKSSASNLPTFFVPQNIQPPLAVAKIAAALAKSDFAATNIRIIEDGQIAVYNQAGIVAIFSAKRSTNEQVDSLQQVLAKAKIDAAKIAKIDLRFDKPVVSYKVPAN